MGVKNELILENKKQTTAFRYGKNLLTIKISTRLSTVFITN